MTILSFLLFTVFLFYISANLYTRFSTLSGEYKKHIGYFVLVSSFFAVFYLFNIYMFNNGLSLSYGSDSSYFERIFIDMSKKDFSSSEYEFIVSEHKSFSFILFYPIYALSDNYIVNALVLFFINYVTYLLTMITALQILLHIFKDEKMYITKYYLIYFFPAFLIIFSFLRDVYNLFFVIEIAYLLFVSNKHSLYRWGLIALGLFSLMYIRDFFAYIIFLYVVLHFTKQKYRSIIFIGLIATVTILIPNDVLTGVLGRLLLLAPGDMEAVASQTMSVIDTMTFYNEGYSLSTLFSFVFDRFTLGGVRFTLSPLFSQYLIYNMDIANQIMNYYNGFEYKVSLILNAFIYNFLLFPMMFSFMITFKHNYKHSIEIQKNIYTFLLLILVTILAVYSIKFFGGRNFKIDFLYQFLWLIVLSTQKIHKKYFLVGVIIMITLNVIFGYKIFYERLM